MIGIFLEDISKLVKDRSIFQKNYLILTSNNRGFLQTNNSIFFGRKKT